MNNEQPQLSEERIEELRGYIGKEIFVIAYTLQGNGEVEVMEIADVMASPAGHQVAVVAKGRAWRTHTLGVDAFFTLKDAFIAVTEQKKAEIKQLRDRADALVTLHISAPADKIAEEESRAKAEAEAEAEQASKTDVTDVVPK